MQKQILIPKNLSKEVIAQIGWSPALKVGNEVLISAIGGVTHPQEHIFSVGETIEDQVAIIIEHFEDILGQAGGTLDSIVELTVYVRPMVTDEDMKLAAKAVTKAFIGETPTESWIKVDFAGSKEELLQIKARAILTK